MTNRNELISQLNEMSGRARIIGEMDVVVVRQTLLGALHSGGLSDLADACANFSREELAKLIALDQQSSDPKFVN